MLRLNGLLPEDVDYRIAQRALLEDLLYYTEKFSMRKRVMMRMRFRDGYTYSEIGAAFGFSDTKAKRQIVALCKIAATNKEKDCCSMKGNPA